MGLPSFDYSGIEKSGVSAGLYLINLAFPACVLSKISYFVGLVSYNNNAIMPNGQLLQGVL